MPADTKRRCFVIMPFSESSADHSEEYWTKHYEGFLKPLIEQHPLLVHKSSPLRGDILRQIITDLVTSNVVIADLTNANPNVYWELGVRQSFKHCTITIAEHGTKLPFDIGVKGTLFYYPEDHIKNGEFTKLFKTAIEDCLNDPQSTDSHVLETISGRGSLYQVLMKEESLRKLDAVISEITHNREVMTNIMRCCKSNGAHRIKEDYDKLEIITDRFRVISIENLIVNRYVDADEDFFSTCEVYYSWINEFEQQISSWDILFGYERKEDSNEKSGLLVVEQWLFENIPFVRKIIRNYLKLLKQEQSKLSLVA